MRSELRRDPLQGTWVIIAPSRGWRPRDPVAWTPAVRRGEDCPFCPGREDQTPPAVYTLPDKSAGSAWRLRVFPNRYPALFGDAECGEPAGGEAWARDLHQARPGRGRHEVLVETPDHDRDLADYDPATVAEVLETWRLRLADFYADPAVAHGLIFRNRGPLAGATLAHPHTQLLGAPQVPGAVAAELACFAEHRRRHGGCLLCDLLRLEEEAGERLILAAETCVLLAPWASRFAGEMLILPRRHESDFRRLRRRELADLARLLREACRRLAARLDDPDYNLVLHTAPNPVGGRDGTDYHWHLEILPRTASLAGFEAGTGFAINPLPPEEAARLLREPADRPSPSRKEDLCGS